jgi:putative hydrolase of the HAD superfamily
MNLDRAVIFDLDDTLYPERDYAFSGFAAVAQAFVDILGDPRTSAADMRRLFETPRRPRVFNALLAERGRVVDDHLIARMVEAFRSHDPRIALYPDADRALTRFRGRLRLGLITDGPAAQQWKKVDALQLRPRVERILLTAELGPGFGKPDSRSFEQMSGRLGLSGAACCYVADNPAKDFIAPNALGWRTVRALRPDGIYRDTPVPQGGAPQHVISSLDDLDALLR